MKTMTPLPSTELEQTRCESPPADWESEREHLLDLLAQQQRVAQAGLVTSAIVHDVNNYLHVVRRYDGMDLKTGIQHVVQVHDRELNQFCQLDGVVRDRSPEARRCIDLYVMGCRNWMSGALRWQQIAPRYASGRKMLDEESTIGSMTQA